MRSARTYMALFTAVVLTIVGRPVLGQVEAKQRIFTQAPVPEVEMEAETIGLALDFESALLPGRGSLLFRSLTLGYSLLDQADRVFVGGDPILPASFLEVGDTTLNKFDLKLAPGSWFRTPKEFQDAYELAKKAPFVESGSDPLLDRKFDAQSKKLHFLAWAKRSGAAKRLLDSTEFTISSAERSEVASMMIVPPNLRSQNKRATTYSFVFDPKNIVVFPEQVASAYNALEKHVDLHKSEPGLKDPTLCTEPVLIDRLRCLSEITVRPRWVAGLIPEVKLERVDQFEFLANAGGFVRSPFVEDDIDTLTVQWDLAAALNSSEHRRAALNAVLRHQALYKVGRQRAAGIDISPTSLEVREGQMIFLPLKAEYDADVGALEVSKWQLAGAEPRLHLSKEGVLSGFLAPSKSSVVTLRVTAIDKHGGEAVQEIRISVIRAATDRP